MDGAEIHHSKNDLKKNDIALSSSIEKSCFGERYGFLEAGTAIAIKNYID